MFKIFLVILFLVELIQIFAIAGLKAIVGIFLVILSLVEIIQIFTIAGLKAIVGIFLVILSLVELIQIFVSFKRYCASPENLIQVGILVGKLDNQWSV